MNELEHIAVTAMEEANEVAQRISKALRFGWTEVQPGQSLTNAERVIGEFHDLFTMIEWLRGEGCLPHDPPLVPPVPVTLAKRAKVKKFMAISREQGTLS